MQRRHHDSIDSTSLQARRDLAAGALPLAGVLYTATEQTAGVGRLRRPWASPQGGLWCTLAAPLPPGPPADALGLRVGLACLRALRTFAGPADATRFTLKWPNDILLDRRKVLGALTEIVPGPRGVRWALVGVGVNADFPAAALPPPLAGAATTLRDALGRPAPPDELLPCLLPELLHALAGDESLEAVAAAVASSLADAGAVATMTMPDGVKRTVRILGLDASGRLAAEHDGAAMTLPDGVA